jgi:hypothetical protein
MRKQLLCSCCSVVGMGFLFGLAACSDNSTDAGGTGGAGDLSDAGTLADGSHPQADVGQSCEASAISGSTYVLIDDMETTTHGPIELEAVSPPLTQGYWYNSGANYFPDGGLDTSNPLQGSFVFTALTSPTTTLDCKKVSEHAARQSCALNGLYDTCGVGFEFAQQPDPDAGVVASSDAAVGDAGDAGPSIPRVTVPFDISRYKAFTFWGMTTTPDPVTGSMQVKVQFPDTDTDPRGEICNGASPNISNCYNSYGALFKFTPVWQQFTVVLDAGDGGKAPQGGIAIDPTFGYQRAQWIPTQVYGINWQAQRNTVPDAGPALMTDIWIDDLYFIE